jgi:hypothetical protein
MKKLLSLLSIFAIVLSCSSDETSTPVTPPAPIVKYTITLTAGEGGTVSTTGGEFEAGQTVSVTATPQGEYLFKDWSDGNTNATRTITVSSNTTLTANFEKRKYPLTVNIEGEGEVLEEIVNAGRSTDYDSGTTLKLTAVPIEGWEFVGWSGDITSNVNPVQLNISSSKSVTATFVKLMISSLRIVNPIDTLVITRKHKYVVEGIFSNGTIVDLTDSITYSTIDDKVTLLKNKEFTAGKSGLTTIKLKYNQIELENHFFIKHFEEIVNEVNPYLRENDFSTDINVPVVIINYHPTQDGKNVDPRWYPDNFAVVRDRFYNFFNYTDPQNYVNRNICDNPLTENPICDFTSMDIFKLKAEEIHMFTKYGIEEASKFRGYKNPNAEKGINIQIVKYFNFYEMNKLLFGNSDIPEPNYSEVFEAINLESLVENYGVKEVWFSLHPLSLEYPSIIDGSIPKDLIINLGESNMSSPYGDVSNSSRITGDLPVYSKTYTVYGINLDRGPGESLHNRGHQIEAQFGYIDRNNNDHLFWNKFVGIKLNERGQIDWSKQSYNGRCGNTHFPPNASGDYDWGNQVPLNSDINNWIPSGGLNESVNTSTWTEIEYNLPFETKFYFEESNLDSFRYDTQYKWLLYWFQSIPGKDNNIPYVKDGINYKLTNWWDIFYNWDDAIRENKTLWE